VTDAALLPTSAASPADRPTAGDPASGHPSSAAAADLSEASAAAANTTSPPGTDAILVRLGAGKFAVDLASVAEVGRVPVVTRVPGLPAWLAGVANWRGRILPVLDLRALLGADAGALGSQARLIVLTDAGIAVGMVVDLVDGTTSLADVAPFPAASAPSGSTLLSGQSPRDDGPVAVLDVAAVLRLRDGLSQGRRSA
jgi:purine-binding chemotaxis protein CheW